MTVNELVQSKFNGAGHFYGSWITEIPYRAGARSYAELKRQNINYLCNALLEENERNGGGLTEKQVKDAVNAFYLGWVDALAGSVTAD